MSNAALEIHVSMIRIPVLGAAFAGKAAPMDPEEIVSWRDVRPIKGAGPQDVYCATPVCGDSLKDNNIVDGDWLIMLYTRFAEEGDLVVAFTPSGRTVKYLYPQDDGTVVLRGANSAYDDQQWLEEDVRIQGVVKRIERDL